MPQTGGLIQIPGPAAEQGPDVRKAGRQPTRVPRWASQAVTSPQARPERALVDPGKVVDHPAAVGLQRHHPGVDLRPVGLARADRCAGLHERRPVVDHLVGQPLSRPEAGPILDRELANTHIKPYGFDVFWWELYYIQLKISSKEDNYF